MDSNNNNNEENKLFDEQVTMLHTSMTAVEQTRGSYFESNSNHECVCVIKKKMLKQSVISQMSYHIDVCVADC